MRQDEAVNSYVLDTEAHLAFMTSFISRSPIYDPPAISQLWENKKNKATIDCCRCTFLPGHFGFPVATKKCALVHNLLAKQLMILNRVFAYSPSKRL